MTRILVEPSDYHFDNAGDTAMLRVALSRLSTLWHEGMIHVFSAAPERFPPWAPNVIPIDVHGRRAWLHEPLLTDWVPSAVPSRLRNLARRVDWALRHVRPDLVRSLVLAKLRRRGENGTSVEAFFDTVRQADLVVTTGMGGVTDAFPQYARALLQVLDLAQQHGAVTAMMGQGIGPLNDRKLRSQAAAVLRKVDLIAVRERRAGVPLLRELGVRADRVIVTGDDAIELAHAVRPEHPGHALGINLRAATYSGVNGRMLDRLIPIFRGLVGNIGVPALPIVISSVAGERDALTAHRILQDDRGDDPELDLPQLLERIRSCRVVVAGSYHAAVFALSMGIPAVGLYGSPYYRDKFLGLADMFGDGCWVLSLEDPDLETTLLGHVRTAWDKAEMLRQPLLAAAESQIAESRAAYDRLKDLVERRRNSHAVPRPRESLV